MRFHRRTVLGVVQAVVAAGLLVSLVRVFGTAPFAAGLDALTVPSVAAALGLGAIGTAAQAQRWRLVSSGYRMHLPLGGAVGQCYEASFLNAVLPGGLAGDAVRTARQRSAYRTGWLSSIGSVLGERLAGTVIVLLAAAVALVGADWRFAVAAGLGAVLLLVVARPSLRRLPRRSALAVWALSVLGWASYAALFAVSSALTAPDVSPLHVAALAAISLAGMSIPLSVGGWGPREGIAALAFMMFGYPGSLGLEVSVGYGLLALVSVLPGAVLLLVLAARALIARRQPGAGSSVSGLSALSPSGEGTLDDTGKIELSADICPENESPDRSGNRP